MRRIHDLSRYIEEHPGRHVVVPGTFAIPHLGHVKLIRQGVFTVMQEHIANPAIILPNSWNRHKYAKTPPLATRLRWLEMTLQDFASNVVNRIVFAVDSRVSEDYGSYSDIVHKNPSRIIRVAGDDKEPDYVSMDGRLRVVWGPRHEGLSTTEIRKVIASDDPDKIRTLVSIMSQRVLADFVSSS